MSLLIEGVLYDKSFYSGNTMLIEKISIIIRVPVDFKVELSYTIIDYI